MVQDGDKPYDIGEDVVLELLWDGKEKKKTSVEEQDNAMMTSTTDLAAAAAAAEDAEAGNVGALHMET
eukprot:SAG31_NODE_10493_length_1132_cov_1.189739_1_plen_68_part_00